MSSASLSLKEYLKRKNIIPSAYGDYQDFIEQKQTTIKPSLYREDIVPVRGSVHLTMGRIVSAKNINDKWKKIS